MRSDVGSLRAEFAEFRGEARVIFRILGWAGAALVAAVLTQGVAWVWYVAKLDSRIDGYGQRIEKVEKAVEPKPSRP